MMFTQNRRSLRSLRHHERREHRIRLGAVWTFDLRDSSAGAPTCNLRRQADACFDRKNMGHLNPTQSNIGKPLPLGDVKLG